MKRILTTLCGLFALLCLLMPAAWTQPGPPLSTLQPGDFLDLRQNLTINLVFVGYRQGTGPQEIDEGRLRSILPQEYRDLVRFRNFLGIRQFVGNSFHFDYNVVYADQSFEDDFFAYLSAIGTPKPLTLYQLLYNYYNFNNAILLPDTPTSNLWIEALSVEKWLADNAPARLGIDTRSYTIFFINWYSRPDFQPHVYVKSSFVDPDTGYPRGVVEDARKMIAYGGFPSEDVGSLQRIWFYDLSAGPEAWTENWDVDDLNPFDPSDFDPFDTLYRMPPIWEYGNPLPTYRPFDSVSFDLGLIARFVAINLLFTTSPLYDPALSPPRLPTKILVDLNVVQYDPTTDGKQFFKPLLMADAWRRLQPYNSFGTLLRDSPNMRREIAFYTGFASMVYGFVTEDDLFRFHNDLRRSFLTGRGDYELVTVEYNATDDAASFLLGISVDNLINGTQTFSFGFDWPDARSAGYGFTTDMIHEVGHHLGLSHPHDGYDWVFDFDYGPDGFFWFAQSGDESDTIMNYMDLSLGFSQFDRDNMNRYMTTTYINQANNILVPIYANPHAGQVSATLLQADTYAADAVASYENMDYAAAAFSAKRAYDAVRSAAEALGIIVKPFPSLPVGPRRPPLTTLMRIFQQHGSKFTDTWKAHRADRSRVHGF
ncbi:MAG TPA: hypothetical protein VFB38_06840 [Chthonomonadaceae bacterium]|nr:hypothetical protein [Chthonomonadaceae bacterium]